MGPICDADTLCCSEEVEGSGVGSAPVAAPPEEDVEAWAEDAPPADDGVDEGAGEDADEVASSVREAVDVCVCAPTGALDDDAEAVVSPLVVEPVSSPAGSKGSAGAFAAASSGVGAAVSSALGSTTSAVAE